MSSGVKAILGVLIVFFVGVWFGYEELKPKKNLPVFHPADVKPQLVDSSLHASNRAHYIAPFELINQYGDTVTEDMFDGAIYVADFFFTTCRSICPKMTSQMERIQTAYKHENGVKLLSHSVTPEKDSVSVLLDYAAQYGAKKNKWHLVTGPKKHIYDLARKSYFAVLDHGDGGAQDFIHTENFVLVDTNRQIRGFYDGTSEEEVNQLMADIAWLLEEGNKD